MSAPLRINAGPPGDGDELVKVLDRFEDAWERGLAPRVEDYLTDCEISTVLVSLVHIDLERRLKAAEPVRVESYLERFPALEANPSAVLDLIEAEFSFRKRVEPALVPAEYVSRFPRYEGELLKRLTIGIPSTAANFLVPETLAPPAPPGYEILEELGRGGMGVVLLARDLRTGERVAVKMLRPDLAGTPQAVRMFLREAGHMARLQHPNILSVLALSAGHESTYYVMPYLPRGPLARLLQDRQPLAREAILPIVRQVGEALHFAHERGIIHRDLKPANILLGDDGKAYLADFGLLRSLYNDSLLDVRRPQCLGTAPYMSPGIAAGHAEDVRCDIYAFGAVLYELLTARPPYVGADAEAVISQVLKGPPEPIREINPRADCGLARIAEGAMARALRDRYAVMEDVLGDLDRVAAGEEPLGPNPRPTKPPRRRIGVVALTAVLLAAFGALAAGLWMLGEARTPLSVVGLHVEVFRGEPPQSRGRLGQGLSAAHQHDQVVVSCRLSRRAYCYLVALNTDGDSAFCPKSAADIPPSAIREFVYPAPGPFHFQLSDGRGMQGFVVVASLRPLKPYNVWLAEVGALPWKPAPPTGGWTFGGRGYRTLDDLLRGQEPNPNFPAGFEAVCSFLHKREEFDVIEAITFPVKSTSD